MPKMTGKENLLSWSLIGFMFRGVLESRNAARCWQERVTRQLNLKFKNLVND